MSCITQECFKKALQGSIPKPAGFSPPGDYILQPGPDVCYGADQFTCGLLEFNLKCSKDGGGFFVALACYGRLTFRVVDM